MDLKTAYVKALEKASAQLKVAEVLPHEGGQYVKALEKSSAQWSVSKQASELVPPDWSIDREIARGDLGIRRKWTNWILWLFVGINIVVVAGLAYAFHSDQILLEAGKISPDQRIVNADVVMALLGATTVQLGTVAVVITQSIFPKK